MVLPLTAANICPPWLKRHSLQALMPNSFTTLQEGNKMRNQSLRAEYLRLVHMLTLAHVTSEKQCIQDIS